jgi:hypothetical protein
MEYIVKRENILKQLIKLVYDTLKLGKMVLHATTKSGLTWGQVFAFLGLLSALLVNWIDVKVEMAQIRTSTDIRLQELEKGKNINEENIKTVRKEIREDNVINKEDHEHIMDKLDLLIQKR